ncbi:MAG: heavy metal translocating P-type ATPase [Devosia sp.]
MSTSSLRDYALVLIALLGLAAGAALYWFGDARLAPWVWGIATVPVLLGLLWQIVASLRRGDLGLDVVAALSMSAALVFGETLAGNVVALMYAGGQVLESYAQGRARREMSALLGRVSRTAMRYCGDRLEEVPIAEVAPGDELMIRHGEVVPVDGTVLKGPALLDLSALTGESVPARLEHGGEVLSGSTSTGPAFRMAATRPASESTYAGIVRLVEAAQQARAPMVRLADRYAWGFLLLTLALAGAAWALSGDPIRALAVLVVATPCPLILAVPVAIISGLSRSARHGVLIKNGGTLEQLARVRTAILDKTGTLTRGSAEVVAIRTAGWMDEDEVLRLAASLDQASGHVLAAALIAAARARGLPLSPPTEVHETPGTGLEGLVEGRRVLVGGNSFVHSRSDGAHPRELHAGLGSELATIAVAVDGALAGVIVLEDPVRPDADALLRELRDSGISRIVLASGDRTEIAAAVGKQLQVDAVLSELAPEHKVDAVAAEQAHAPVLMVGDGVNDAPALAAADVGVAMGARGAAASSEAAGVVLLVDEIRPLANAIGIAKRTRAIALQSVYVGLGLSVGGMVFAALGYLAPVQGALLQEVIDVAVILNALRALR